MTKGSKIVFRIVRWVIDEPRGIPWLDLRGVATQKGRGWGPLYHAAVVLKALLAISQIAVRLIDLVFLEAVALVCFVTSDSAASRRSQ